MTDERQRIAIAEACGFSDIMGDMGFHQKMSDEKVKEAGGEWRFPIPDYLSDLNAIHEAENAIGLHYDHFRSRKLKRIWEKYISSVDPRFATAAQRAEAFLRTVGRWEDE